MNSKLILGTVQLGLNYGINNNIGKPPKETAINILKKAQEYGIDTIDTAKAYGDSIDIISEFHNKNKPFNIITKFIYKEDIDLNAYILTLIKKLNIQSIHTLMYHRFSDLENSTIIDALQKMKENRMVKNIGVSIYNNDEFENCIYNEQIDVIQLPYNLLDNFSIRGDLLIEAKRKNKTIHARSVFLQGLFFKDVNTLPENLIPLKNDLLKLQSIASNFNFSIQELALNYALHTKEIDNVLFGVENN